MRRSPGRIRRRFEKSVASVDHAAGEMVVRLCPADPLVAPTQVRAHPLLDVHLDLGHHPRAVAVVKGVGPATQGAVEFRDDVRHGYRCATPGSQCLRAVFDPLHRPPQRLHVRVALAFAAVAATP